MKAMVLAAGLGTRLRPMTDTLPKALVDVNGRTLLQITLERLRAFGVHDVIVNVHHLADAIVSHLETNAGFGLHVEVSREEVLLDTGGGLRKAAWFFLEDGPSDEPFILHNVDVLSSVDLEAMRRHHVERQALATLAVLERPTSRALLFDDEQLLVGHRAGEVTQIAREAASSSEKEFTGIHIISPRLLPLMDKVMSLPATGDRPFSIISAYLKLASAGQRIAAFPADAYAWCDVGSPDSLERAREMAGGNG